MCGLAGLFDPTGVSRTESAAALVAGMTATLTHRGPDGQGYWSDAEHGVFFGHRRLEVVGVGPEGSQPMHSADGRWVVSYNGEIYNHGPLRRRLANEGLAFRGSSDTEVLVGAVQHWGLPDALTACEGMFAFALWDRHRRELHLVRDRFGEKPLYYGWVAGSLAFASELKALCTLPRFDAEIDRDAVALFLRHNCIPAPHTIYRHVAKLEPGELATFGLDARPGRHSARHYWSARDAIAEARARPVTDGPEAVADRLETVLSESVAARMVADVPVGAFLSGGIDSSLIVALMQRHSRVPVRTFTVGFVDRAFDESAEAAAVAAHLGTDHTPLEVHDVEAAEVIPALPDIWDEPFGDVSQIPMHLVSRLARTQVTVSLSGDGGDELFAGYNRHAWLERLWRRSSGLPGPVRRSAGAALGSIPPALVESAARAAALLPGRPPIRNPSSKVAKVAKVMGASGAEDAYLSLASYWDDAESMVIGAGPTVSVASRPSEWPELDGITEQMLWLDLVGYLPDDILTKLDRAAMAVSLETRVPFLDRAVFDLAWRLPLSLKLRDGTTKWILRQVLHRHVPAELIERPKMGFGFPIGAMLRGPLRPWAEELLAEDRLIGQDLLDPVPIRQAWRQHLGGRRDLSYELWDVLSLQSWLGHWVPSLGR
ncbi:MAG TPA: asparagine synthase (glutamine-hydrolyzing) [Acidimicrobiales bacterium]|nr:asparagine synthase (glutamine-hydrolyzing) [Acidimicrobiales bacterium]